MHRARSVSIALILCAGCGGAPRGASTSDSSTVAPPTGVGPGEATLAPQSELAATFPAAMTSYVCQWVEASGYMPEKNATPIEIAPAAIKVHPTGASKHTYGFTEYPIDAADGAYVIAKDGDDEEERSVVLGDGVVYLLVEAAGADVPEIQLACALESEQGRITGLTPAAHRERLRAYAESRRQAALANADLDLGDLDLDLGDVALDDDGEASGASRWTEEQARQIARARTMTSFTFEASAASDREHIKVVVVVTLADGSTMRIGRGDPIFPALFGTSRAGNEVSTMVDVWPLDEDGVEIKRLRQYQEISYTAPIVGPDVPEGGSQGLLCQGAPGDAGIERNWNDNGRLYYRGQPGQRGPAITVEITTLSPSRPDALRYRLRCDKQDKVFLASATTEVTVTTVGGNGGYGIEKGNGDGSSGGDGGDGGDITVRVDPSVGSYRLTTVSRGGKGGNPSKQANGSFVKGDRGRDGSEGSVDERREAVTIP